MLPSYSTLKFNDAEQESQKICLGYNLRHDSNIRQLASDSNSPDSVSVSLPHFLLIFCALVSCGGVLYF